MTIYRRYKGEKNKVKSSTDKSEENGSEEDNLFGKKKYKCFIPLLN